MLLKRFEEDLGPRAELMPSMSRSLSEKDVLAEQQKTETIREELSALGIARTDYLFVEMTFEEY